MDRYVQLLRKEIAQYCENTSEFVGQIECDESYFGGKKKDIIREYLPKKMKSQINENKVKYLWVA